MTPTPPAWAESLLRAFLEPGHVESVSGDLLETYRDSIHPARGGRRADAWYVRQVLGFVARGTRVWAALLGGAFVTRMAFDWLVPVADFHERAMASTWLAIGILLAVGLWASWRSGSVLAGTVAGVAVTAIGAAISIAGVVALLALWHDPRTLAAIHASGGLTEAFDLPLLLIAPGAVLGTIGGALGGALNSIYKVSRL